METRIYIHNKILVEYKFVLIVVKKFNFIISTNLLVYKMLHQI